MSHVHHTPITELPADDLPDEEVVLSDPERVPSLTGLYRPEFHRNLPPRFYGG